MAIDRERRVPSQETAPGASPRAGAGALECRIFGAGGRVRRAQEDRLARREVRASVAGIVKSVEVTTIGGVVQPGAAMAKIVPIDEQGNIYYDVSVRTDRNCLGAQVNPLPIVPGRIAQVGIVTGKKTVLQYLMKPILRAREAFRER